MRGGVRYSVIAAQQRIWVSSLKDDYTEIVFDAAWEELLDEDTLYSLNKMIGKN